jgi:hypothetical protein
MTGSLLAFRVRRALSWLIDTLLIPVAVIVYRRSGERRFKR